MYGSVIKGLDQTYLNSRPVKIYDVDKKQLIAEEPSVSRAAKLCGVSTQTVSRLLKSKGRLTQNNFNKTICFR